VILTGGLVALRTEPGRLVVRDPATGAERWHYARAGSASGGLAATEDGRTLLADFAVRDRDFVVALDSASGTVRWQRWQPAGTATFVLPTAVLTTIPDGVAAFGHQATAYDPATGRRLWSAGLGQWCHQVSGLAGAAGATVVLTPCRTDDRVAANSELGIRATGSRGQLLWQATIAHGVPVEPSSILLANQDAVAVHGPTGADVFDPATGRPILHTADEQPLAAGGAHLVLAAHGRIVVRDGNTGALTQPQPAASLVPQGGEVRAADIRDGSAYVLVEQQDNRSMTLADIDLTSGATVGTWRLPAAFSTRYATWPVSVKAGDGEVIVSGLATGANSAGVAVRVP
jgi:outer membrane protein assembly factor BamB